MADIAEKAEKKHRVRGFFRTAFNFNVRKWMAVDEIKANSRIVVNAYKDLFGKRAASEYHSETFAAAAQRLGMTAETLKKQRRNFMYFSLLYLVLGIGLFGYSFYLLFGKNLFLAFFVSFIMSILMFIYSYKEHFWYMQISKQKLGCTFKEWLRFLFKRA